MADSMPVLREPKQARGGSRKLLIILSILFIVLLAVLFFNSPISKISDIEITGLRYASEEEVRAAIQIGPGDSYFSTNEGTIAQRIKQLKTVELVTVQKSFPGRIVITIQEYRSVAFEVSPEGEVTVILSSGTSVVPTNQEIIVDKPILSKWSDDDPNKGALSNVLSSIPAELLSDFSEIVPNPSNSYPDRIKIYTRTQFEVVTAISLLEEKINYLGAVIETQEPGKITMLLADTYTPFSQEEGENGDSEEKDTTQ